MEEQSAQPKLEGFSEFAIVSLVLGLLAFLNLANLDKIIAAVVFGALALRRISRTGQRGKGLAIAGMALAVIAGTFLTILLIRFWPQIQEQIRAAAAQR
jgi:ABC-type cobalamin transport system permease subunit